MDDNKEILKLIEDRMSFGKSKYGHGVRVDEDVSHITRSGKNSWLEMQMEEILDGMIYSAASIIRLRRHLASSSEERPSNL